MTPVMIPTIFTKNQCESIISFHSDWTENIGAIGEEEEGRIEYDIRKCQSYVPPTIEHIPHWFINNITKTSHTMNQKHYNFDLGKGNFELNLLKYDSGGHYKTHMDIQDKRSRRKISFTLLLNDSYEGGQLKFLGFPKSEFKTGTGDMIIFPSYLTHMVEPVTSGVRWALVGWILGDKHFV